MAAHTTLGYLLAVGLAGADRGERLGRGAARPRCSGSCVSTAARWPSTARSTGTKATSPTCGDPPPPPARPGRCSRWGSWWLGSSPRWRCRRSTGALYGLLLRPVGAVLGPAVPAQGGGRRRLAHQHVGLRHPDAVGGLGRRPVGRSRPSRDSCCSPSARSSPRSIRSPSSTSSRRTHDAATGHSP